MKITLKDGQLLTLKRIRGKDYEDVMTFLDKFSRDKGAIWTNQYPGQPKKDKEKSVAHYESKTELFLGVWDDKEMIAEGSISLSKMNHPWVSPQAEFALSILEKYTSLGLGTILLKELEKWAIQKKVHRIKATVRHNNRRGIGLYLKSGYQIEGMARETAFFNNQWQHSYYIAKIVSSKF
ncbi:MAG: GNAT family N-acetyltransferase [Pseudomonadota bacterium]|nr:GNAT family N-acetyltransferase [Pseudomonadota bacterium]